MGLDKMALSNDEYCMIVSNHFAIGTLAKKGAGMNHAVNDWGNIWAITWTMTGIFTLAMLSMVLPMVLMLACLLLVLAIVGLRLFIFVLYLLAVVHGKYLKPFYRSSIIFWGFWPALGLALSIAAVGPGILVGEWLWTTCLDPYFQLKELQMYRDVNPHLVSGRRLQDAGMIDFVTSPRTEIDRAKGGCFMNSGHTYCVAPIVKNGVVRSDLVDMPASGSYDYFAVGVDCCTCPNKDFKCGEWENPYASGAFRSLDYRSRPFYKLALDDWIDSYGKPVKNPIFLDWVEEPEWKWKRMWNTALYVGTLAVISALAASLTIGFLLDKVLQVLWSKDVVAPRVGLAPAVGCSGLTQVFLPRMFFYYQDEQEQLAAMPVGTTEYRSTPGPGSISAATGYYGSVNQAHGGHDAGGHGAHGGQAEEEEIARLNGGLPVPSWGNSGILAAQSTGYY